MNIADALSNLSTPADRDTLLRIYLNDHLAGSAAGRELAKRCRGSNEGTPLADFLATFVAEVEEERDVILRVLEAIEGSVDQLKQGAAAVAERLGRLKLNGQLRGYSDLSRLWELEGLSIGVEGKRNLWRSLVVTAQTDTRLSAFSFEPLIEQATRQREMLELFRIEAAEQAFSA